MKKILTLFLVIFSLVSCTNDETFQTENDDIPEGLLLSKSFIFDVNIDRSDLDLTTSHFSKKNYEINIYDKAENALYVDVMFYDLKSGKWIYIDEKEELIENSYFSKIELDKSITLFKIRIYNNDFISEWKKINVLSILNK